MLGKTKSAGNLIKEYKMNIQLRGSLYETFKGIQRRTVISDSVNEKLYYWAWQETEGQFIGTTAFMSTSYRCILTRLVLLPQTHVRKDPNKSNSIIIAESGFRDFGIIYNLVQVSAAK